MGFFQGSVIERLLSFWEGLVAGSFGEGMYVIYTHCFLFMIPGSRKSNRSPFYKSTLRVLEMVEIVNVSMMEFPQVDVAQSFN